MDDWERNSVVCVEAREELHTLHLALVVDNDSGVVLEEKENTIFTTECLSLPDNHGWHDLTKEKTKKMNKGYMNNEEDKHYLLSQFRLSLFAGGDDHVTDTGSGESVEACLHVDVIRYSNMHIIRVISMFKP